MRIQIQLRIIADDNSVISEGESVRMRYVLGAVDRGNA
jgi:hypothetical protein